MVFTNFMIFKHIFRLNFDDKLLKFKLNIINFAYPSKNCFLAMKTKLLASLIIASALIGGGHALYAGPTETAVQKVFSTYRPGSTGFREVTVNKVTINTAAKTVTVNCSDEATYLPLTAERLAQLKADILAKLGAQYKNYKVKITTKGKNLDDLVLFATKAHGPKEKGRFVTNHQAQPAPKGLDDANIALWQSHGWYFEPKLNRWEWQRARVMQTVEDLYTQSYVMPFLMPMLENAGAYVMSPRERDTNLTEIIVDADNGATPGYSEKNGAKKWEKSGVPGFAWDGKYLVNGQHPFSDGSSRKAKTVKKGSDDVSEAIWSANIPADDTYAVYVSYATLPNSATDATYTINTAKGPQLYTVNQKMGGGTWIYLGHFPLKAGNYPVVTLTNESADKDAVVTADAVKIGGGMGVVSRIVKEGNPEIDYEYVASGYPKFTEGARYFLQWAGAPDSVFTPSDYVNDYTDDYRSRGLWVNWLAGGSSQIPDSVGLGIPVDLSLAFHSDAGTFANDSVVGTLGIYCTNGETLGNGDSRLASRDLTDLIMTNIVEDVRAEFEPSWTRRGMWDQSYFEARVPLVPAMLLELLSHQNFFDMQYGLDPAFRFTVSRGIYKGMLKFIAQRDGRDYVVQPLPVNNFAINHVGNRSYLLNWQETVDRMEPTAKPTYYIIERREGTSGPFTFFAKVETPYYSINVGDDKIYSFRIIAGNEGGVSFPSEVLSLCDLGNGSEPVLVVNGFTRVSAPDHFDFGESFAGFYDEKDHGVPYVQDISFIGSQFEYRRDIPWMDDDAAGFGASRSNYETKVIAGNTFDYTVVHGAAIVAAGRSFYSTSVGAYQLSDTQQDPKFVDLILGKQKEIKQGRGFYGTRFKAFPSELQNKIKKATEEGTSFFISGAFVATDIWDNPNSSEEVAEADREFAKSTLGYIWRVGQASVTGEAYEVPSQFKAFKGGKFEFSNTLNSECYVVESPDSFYPADERGATIMRYSENNLIAGTATDFGTYRTVVIGFPFETIAGASPRASLMKQVLNFITKK